MTLSATPATQVERGPSTGKMAGPQPRSAPALTQTERVIADLRAARPGWVCGIHWVREYPAILRYGARIWDARHKLGHVIEERICEHGVGEYRLVIDADHVEPTQLSLQEAV